MKGAGMLFICFRCQLWILVPLSVLRTERQVPFRVVFKELKQIYGNTFKIYLIDESIRQQYLYRHLGYYSCDLSVCFRMVSCRGQIKLEPRPDWSALGVIHIF